MAVTAQHHFADSHFGTDLVLNLMFTLVGLMVSSLVPWCVRSSESYYSDHATASRKMLLDLNDSMTSRCVPVCVAIGACATVLSVVVHFLPRSNQACNRHRHHFAPTLTTSADSCLTNFPTLRVDSNSSSSTSSSSSLSALFHNPLHRAGRTRGRQKKRKIFCVTSTRACTFQTRKLV